MYKVLIADDEVKVCKLINNLIEWEQFGLEVAAMVHDGVAALDFIKEERPDIVITDIRMPGYDGIELIKQAKEFDPEINFIIVSGYRHFDYAHNAIKYGVEDYLLKPLKKAELINTLNKMLQKKERINLGQIETADMKRRIELDDRIMKQTFLNKLLTESNLFSEEITREEINMEYHCNFMEGFYQSIIIKPSLTIDNVDERSYQLLMDKSREITYKLLEEYYHEVIITIAKEGVVCLVNDSYQQLQGIRKQLKAIRSDILGMRDVFLNVRVTIGIGEAVTNIKDIRASIGGARGAVLNRLIQRTGHILIASNCRKEALSTYDFIDSNFRNKLLNCIETLRSESVPPLMEEIREELLNSKNVDGELILNVCKEIYDIFSFGMAKGFLANKSLLSKEDFESRFYQCDSVQEALQVLCTEITTKIDLINRDKKMADKKPIRIAKQYIKEKYSLPITLEDVSNQVGFNPTYFSSIFKKETNQNFLEYLTDTRIQAAKLLLADTNRSVNQVSEEVGYIDLKHFTRVFKKSTGLTPSEYRKLYY